MTIPDTDALNAERRSADAELVQLDATWKRLGGTPADHLQRGELAVRIRELRARRDHLGKLMATAERKQQALIALDGQRQLLADAVAANVDGLLAVLPGRTELLDIVTLDAQLNAVNAVLANHWPGRTAGLTAARKLMRAFQGLASDLDMTLRQRGALADLTPYEAEIATLREELS